jgi:hypothetical protein
VERNGEQWGGIEQSGEEWGSKDQKSAMLVVEEMKILLVWWYGGMIFSFD